MGSLICDERDQKFVMYEMLRIEELFRTERFSGYSRDMCDMVQDGARKLAEEIVFPVLVEGDREGCRIEDGNVRVPKCFHRNFRIFREGGWTTVSVSPEAGGQGFPLVVGMMSEEWFMHNFSLVGYAFLTAGAAHLIEAYGTEPQKRKYMKKMYECVWGGNMCLTEPGAGTDLGNIRTKAIRQPDGTFLLEGTKQFITGGDQDLTENVISPVLARIEGDPAGTEGISIFLVPKYLVNDDGSLGRRNDYTIAGIEHKIGLNGSATCQMSFGENGRCYAELLGEERQGIKIMFQMMNEARIFVAVESLGSASIAYLHALAYARERVQGSALEEMKNPLAPRVPIIRHPDVRRMLLWMKAHVEGMRALSYYAAWCIDVMESNADPTVKDTYRGIVGVLTPVCKAFCSDLAFRVTETALQVYGGYGCCNEYPVEQFLRDVKPTSIYEGANGIQALDLVGRKLAMKKGLYFMKLLEEIRKTVQGCSGVAGIGDLAADVQEAADTLAEAGLFFASCAASGKFMIPVSNAYTFLTLMGKVVFGWLLLWQARVASETLEKICTQKGVDAKDRDTLAALSAENPEAAFYTGKMAACRYFIKHILPEVGAGMKAIKSEDLSMLEIPEQAFAV
jgi:hypothetical protein